MSEPPDGLNRRLIARGVGMYGTIGIELVLATLVGYWIGTRLDAWLGWEPVGTVFFLIAGAAAGIKRLVTVTRRALREGQEDDPTGP